MDKCIICGKELPEYVKFFKHKDVCCRSCMMKKLHRLKIYEGTSHFNHGYNSTPQRRARLSELSIERHTEKGARGFNSEYSDRLRNRDNLIKRFGLDSTRYLYIAEFEDKIKIGSTQVPDRRFWELNNPKIVLYIKGTTKGISNLECNMLIEFENYTLLDESKTYYTEFLKKDILNELILYIKSNINETFELINLE